MTDVKLTKSGVAYDLNDSPHRVKINYTVNSYFIFVFSSDLYKRKFEEKKEENRKRINESLSNRFGFDIKNDLLCDVLLYKNIEKRGFLIKNNKEGFECLENIRLDGRNLIQKN